MPARTEQSEHIRTFQCTYSFVCYRAGLAICFQTKKTLTWDSLITWQQSFENKTKQKKIQKTKEKQQQKTIHWKNDKSSYELNIDDSKTKFANLFTLIIY